MASSATLPSDPRNDSVDGLALASPSTVSVLSGILFGVAPAWKASRTSTRDVASRSGGGGSVTPRRVTRLVVVQLALSLALLACAASSRGR